jgi:hypothetical protein
MEDHSALVPPRAQAAQIDVDGMGAEDEVIAGFRVQPLDS